MSGGTPSRKNSKFWNGEIPWVSPKDMKVERISDSIEKITEAAVESRISTLPVHSIMIVVRGLILNHSFPVAITEAPVAFNQDMKALVTSNRFDPFYVLYFLQHMKDVVLGMTTTTTHGTKRLASDAIFGLSVPCPPISKQKAFTKKVETMKVGALRAQQNRQSTNQLLKSLIKQIF
jgi:type I restriction enzyme S subunit